MFFNKLFLSVIIGSFFISAAPDITVIAENGQKWETFKSEESGFSIDFPAKPEHVHQQIAVPKTDLTISYDTYIAEPSDSVVYVVSVWYYPSEIDMSKPEVNLKDGFEGMLSALPGSKVMKMDIGTLDKYKALDFLVKHDSIYFQGKLILVHNTLYQVFTVYKEGVEMKKDFNRFINSFKLLSPEKNRTPPTMNGQAKKMNVMLETF